MTTELLASAIFGIAILLYLINYMRQQRKFEREILAEMKNKLFPKILENLRRLVNNLEAEPSIGIIPDSNALEENISPTLLMHFGIRFSKQREKMRDIKEKINIYNQKIEKLSKDEKAPIELKKLSNMSSELKREAKGLVGEIESLIEWIKLPPKKFSI